MPRFFVLLALSVVASVAIYLPGCHTSSDAPAAASSPAEKPPGDIQMFDATTPAALLALLAATPTSDPTRAAALTWTGNGEELPATPIFCFEWDTPKMGQLDTIRRGKQADEAPGWRALLGALGPPRQARADDAATLTGEAYLLELSTPQDDRLLRVFTTGKEYDPTPEEWAKMRAAQTSIKAVIVTATFDHDRIVPGGGPFASAPILFTIAH